MPGGAASSTSSADGVVDEFSSAWAGQPGASRAPPCHGLKAAVGSMACFPEVGTPLCAPRSRVRVEAARRGCRPYLPAAGPATEARGPLAVAGPALGGAWALEAKARVRCNPRQVGRARVLCRFSLGIHLFQVPFHPVRVGCRPAGRSFLRSSAPTRCARAVRRRRLCGNQPDAGGAPEI